MKRDMDLCRKILFAVENQYIDSAIDNLKIEGYSAEQVAYHCKLLYEAKLVSYYVAQYGDNHIWFFAVGSLTWEGHDFLDKIREDTVWNKTKSVIKDKLLPMTLDVIKTISSTIITASVEGAIKGLQS